MVNPELAGAYAYCERLARTHYENFPVASHLLPARMRPHVAAVYAFARLADDMADEGDRPSADRLADLDAWDACLNAAALGAVQRGETHAEVFLALRHTIDECRLPVELLHDLISAFRQDVTVTRYATLDDLMDYCRRSANPVGRPVLRIAGYDRPELDAASDAVARRSSRPTSGRTSRSTGRRAALRAGVDPRCRRERARSTARQSPRVARRAG